MKKQIFTAVALLGTALAAPVAKSAPIVLDPTLGDNNFYFQSVCTLCIKPKVYSGPTAIQLQFTNPGLLNSSGSWSNSALAGGTWAFSYEIRDSLNNLVGGSAAVPGNTAEQVPADIAVLPGLYTVNVFWTFTNRTSNSANWQLVFTTSPKPQVPEPGSLALLGLGVVSLGMFRRRKA